MTQSCKETQGQARQVRFILTTPNIWNCPKCLHFDYPKYLELKIFVTRHSKNSSFLIRFHRSVKSTCVTKSLVGDG